MVKEKMYLHENKLFYLDLGVNVTRNVAQCPLHYVAYAPTEFEVTTSKGLGRDAVTKKTIFDLDLRIKVTRNVAQYPLHYVTYLTTKFEVATSNGLGEDAFTRIVTDGRTDKRMDRLGTKLIYTFSKKKAGIKIVVYLWPLRNCSKKVAYFIVED